MFLTLRNFPNLRYINCTCVMTAEVNKLFLLHACCKRLGPGNEAKADRSLLIACDLRVKILSLLSVVGC